MIDRTTTPGVGHRQDAPEVGALGLVTPVPGHHPPNEVGVAPAREVEQRDTVIDGNTEIGGIYQTIPTMMR